MDYERELLNRLDAMAKHLAVVEEELVRYRRERFLKSILTTLLILLPIIGVGFLVPNFIRKAAQQVAPSGAKSLVQEYLPIDVDSTSSPAVHLTPSAEPKPKPVVVPAGTSTMATSTSATSTTSTSSTGGI